MTIEQIIAQYGLFGLFLGAGFEGETMTVLGGLMAHRGLLPYWPAVLVAAGGSFFADQLFFQLGRRFRDHGFVRRMHARPAFARALAAFERHPLTFTFAFRFIYGLRTVSPVAIGTTRLATRTFVAVNAVAALVWAFIFVSLGYWCGEAIDTLFGRIRSIEHLLAGVVAVALIAALAIHYIRRRPPAA
ncbi:membrane protein DedA with SNARE-associated domain [Novosphingobium sp. PhB165]|uniref:DedA family protein n=1 Tax=Novosphingobium sp. PhB165 TaxID=2485105 RepID=UPI0010508B27|nr:DedA family protein [Novosphingobium sp. PhB165]TCM22440.1 membrane protein DedA with SNARE-associated domain [Novosphingobium sp. PhB165]